jgi:cytochrome c biogenesis protein CcdA
MGAVAGVFGLAVVDSINPSALLVTVFLLTMGGAYARRVLVYASAIFCTYFLLGVLAMTGLDLLSGLADNLVVERVAHATMAVAGLAMLGYALFAPNGGKSPVALPTRLGYPALFLLGLTISAMEFPTAFPYLGALGILAADGAGPLVWVPVLVFYNAILVSPPLVLLAAWRLKGESLRPRLEAFAEKTRAKSRSWALWAVGLIGFLLARVGVVYYLFLFEVLEKA